MKSRVRLALNLKHGSGDAESEAEFDTVETAESIRAAIEKAGYECQIAPVGASIGSLIRNLTFDRPDLVFNLAEGTRGPYREALYPALYDELGIPYTGSDTLCLALTSDKWKANQRIHGVPVGGKPAVCCPSSWLSTKPEDFEKICARIRLLDYEYPLIVKPNFEGSSKGITQTSVVEDEASLKRVGAELLAKYPAGVLVEDYIPGLDVSVAMIGNQILEPCVYRYKPNGRYAIYDLSLKRTGQSLVEAEVPAKLKPDTIERLRVLGRQIFDFFGIIDYGRLDFRIAEDRQGNTEQIWFLECNPLPSLAPGPDAEIYKAAALIGLDQAGVFATIIEGAAKRWAL